MNMREPTFFLQPLPRDFAAVRDELLSRLRALVPEADVAEVGSTAIPELPGKQDLDLLVRAPAAIFHRVRATLDDTFPRDPNQLSSAIYQGYRVPAPFDVAIQLTVHGGPHDRFFDFLDALRAGPALVAAYASLKREFHGRPMAEYRAAKAAFIEVTLARRRS